MVLIICILCELCMIGRISIVIIFMGKYKTIYYIYETSLKAWKTFAKVIFDVWKYFFPRDCMKIFFFHILRVNHIKIKVIIINSTTF